MPDTDRHTSRLRAALSSIWDKAGMLVVFAILFLGCSLFVPNFFSWLNMEGLALSVSTIGIVACTMLFCLASGDFDLSVGSVVACSGVVTAVTINALSRHFEQLAEAGAAVPPAAGMVCVLAGVLAGILAGGFVGFTNGIVIAKFKINALITTLATMQIVRGLGYIVSGGRAVGISQESFFILGTSAFARIPTPVWITIACFVVFGLLLSRTTFGRNTLAIGGNEQAARLAGIPVDRLKIIIFSLQGIMAGFAGVVLASRMTSGQPTASLGFELEVISACVLGGVSLTGGIGSMGSVVAGVLIMGTVQNAMSLSNVETFYQYVARGAILLGAVLFDRFKQARAMRV